MRGARRDYDGGMPAGNASASDFAPGPRAVSRLLDAAQAASLAAGLGAIATAAVTAMTLFPRMREMAVAIPGYAGAADLHWVIAAGAVMHRVFVLVGWAALACAGTALAALLASGAAARRERGPAPLGRILLIGAATGLLAYQSAWLTPKMTVHLAAFHAAAKAGLEDEARDARAEFDALHPAANRVLGVASLGMLGAMALALAACRRGTGAGR